MDVVHPGHPNLLLLDELDLAAKFVDKALRRVAQETGDVPGP
ncbi:MAG TPA: hypothetical protein VHX38_00560 [Pseudonocardiaceae bacterium]|jgi:hypothetical protein|nr:hypothetical protein [Pseudonocardiaceae bacterium]